MKTKPFDFLLITFMKDFCWAAICCMILALLAAAAAALAALASAAWPLSSDSKSPKIKTLQLNIHIYIKAELLAKFPYNRSFYKTSELMGAKT